MQKDQRIFILIPLNNKHKYKDKDNNKHNHNDRKDEEHNHEENYD